MLFGLELLFIAWCIKTVSKTNEDESSIDNSSDSDTIEKFSSGYDLKKNIYWRLDQKYKIED